MCRRRPDVRQAEFTILAESARVGIAKAELYPQFNLKGTLTVDSRTFNNWFTSGSLAYSFGPGIRWDILNFGKLRAAVRVAATTTSRSPVKPWRRPPPDSAAFSACPAT